MNKNKYKNTITINSQQHFSLRKLSVGLASVLLGTSLYLANSTAQTVKADTISDQPKDSEINIVNKSNQQVENDSTVSQNSNESDKYQLQGQTAMVSSDTMPVTNDPNHQNSAAQNNNSDASAEPDVTDTTSNADSNTINSSDINHINSSQNLPTSDNSTNHNSGDTINSNNLDTNKSNVTSVAEKPEAKTGAVYGVLSKDDFMWDATTGTLTIKPKNGPITIQNGMNLFGACDSSINVVNDRLKIKHIKIAEKIKLLGTSSYLFGGCDNLISIDGLNNLDTSESLKMDSMFKFDKSLANLNLSSFDTKNVKDMSDMFNGCHSLVSLDLSSFDTTQVNDMSNMFNDCYRLETLNISSFNTSNVINMYSMFNHCMAVKSLDISNFDMRSVKNMSFMFNWLMDLKSINVPKTTTDSAENMSYLLTNTELKTIDLSWLNTTHVTNMTYMLSGNNKLTNLDLSHFDMSAVTTVKGMLSNLSNLRYITFGNKTNLHNTGFGTSGYWLNVGTGTLHAPQGLVSWSPSELMQNYDPSKNADTYVRSVQFTIRYVDLQNNNQPIPGITSIVYHKLCTDLASDDFIGNYYTVLVTPEMVTTKNNVLQNNYELGTDPFSNGSVNANLNNPYIDYTFSHKTRHEVEKVTHKLIVHYVDENGQALQADSIISKEFSRDRYKDLITNEYSNMQWTSTDTTLPLSVIKGYVTDKATVSTANVTNDKDDEITQVYKKLGNFIPVDKHSNPIAGTQKIQYTNDPTDPTKVLATVPTISGHVAVNKEQMPPDPTKDMYVTYLENNKTIIGFIDQDDNNQMIPGIDNITSSTEIGQTIKKPISLDQVLLDLKNKGYELVTDPLSQPVTATDGEQKLTYVFKHKKDNNQIDTLGKTQTIHFVDANGNKLADDKVTEVTFTRNGIKDLVTNITEWDDWSPEQTLPEVKVPVVTGYIANHAIVVSQKITATDDNVETTITYQKLGQYVPVDKNGKVISATATKTYENDPNDPTKIKADQTLPSVDGYVTRESAKIPEDVTKDTQVVYLQNNKTIIGFIDQDNNNQTITGIDSVTSSTEIGLPIEKPTSIDQIVADLATKGYELVNDPFENSVTATDGNQVINYVFKHKKDNTLIDTITRKQIIHFIDADGNKLADDKVTEVKFTRTGTKDLVTGKTIWSDWSKAQTVPEVKLPVIKGYVTKKAIVTSQIISADKDVTIPVTYQKLGKYVPVDKNGKVIVGVDAISYENDDTDPTKINSKQKLPDIKGYITPKAPKPKDITKNTNVVYETVPVDTGSSSTGNLPDNTTDNKQPDDVPDGPTTPISPTKPSHKPNMHKPQQQPVHKEHHKTNKPAKQVSQMIHHESDPASTIKKAALSKQAKAVLPQTGSSPQNNLALITLGLSLVGLSFVFKPKKKHE